MSRSIKKNPICKDSNRGSKATASRVARRKLNDCEFEIANGNAYRKITQSWAIHDFVTRWSLEDALIEYRNPKKNSYFASEEFRRRYPTEEAFINYWKKAVIRK